MKGWKVAGDSVNPMEDGKCGQAPFTTTEHNSGGFLKISCCSAENVLENGTGFIDFILKKSISTIERPLGKGFKMIKKMIKVRLYSHNLH